MSRTRIHVAVGLSLLAHGIAALLPHSPIRGDAGLGTDARPLVVRLVPAPVPEPSPEIVPTPVQPQEKPLTRQRIEPVRKIVRPEVAPVETPAPVAPGEKTPEPRFDMLAMINARRQRRSADEEAMRRYEEARSANGVQSPEDPALASINRNLQSLGNRGEDTGGIFQILYKGTRTAEFAFNGWRPESNRRWREVIEVDAGPGGDGELAIVRRMIQLIRTHYSGDFIWRSHRLGKSIVLSARVEDSHDLEEFLTREFFDTPTLAHGKAPNNR